MDNLPRSPENTFHENNSPPLKKNLNQSDTSPKQSPDKEKKPEITKEEAKLALKSDTDIARKLLLDGMIQKCLDLAFKTIVENKEALGGENSIYLLPGYFVLAEAFITEGKIKKAVEFLLAASWNFLKFQNRNEEKKTEEEKYQKTANSVARVDDDATEEEFIFYKTWLHKTFSKLYAAENNLVKALDELKIAIYLDSKKYGPEHIKSSFSYYFMGKIFLKKKCEAEADSFYGKVSEIWYKFLKKMHAGTENISELNETLGIFLNFDYLSCLKDELLIKEAFVILKDIENYFNMNTVSANNLHFNFYVKNLSALALLYGLIKDNRSCYEYLQKVNREYLEKYGEEHIKTIKSKERIELFQNEQLE